MSLDRAAQLHRARLLAGQGRPAEAMVIVEGLLADDADDVAALLLKADLLLQSRDGEDALVVYRRAVAAAPESSEAHNALARCLHALERDDEAILAASAARELLPRGDNFRQAGAVYLTLVWCLRERRQFAEALAMAEEGLARTADAVLAQWAQVVEEEFAESQKEEC